jgi:polygalacturonase
MWIRQHKWGYVAVIFIILAGCSLSNSPQQSQFDSKEEILGQISIPDFPDNVLVINDFGALANDSSFDSKPAFDKAMAAVKNTGGGVIVVPPGMYYLNGPIHFVSNINLRIEEGAVLKFASNPEYYLPVVETSWEGTLLYNYSPFIYGKDLTNVAITGKGVIDGEASDTWQNWKEIQKESQMLSRKMNNDAVPLEERIFGKGHYLRPHLVQFYNCRNILIEDVRIEDAPFWCVHLLKCENATLRGMSYDAHNKNNDGIDLEYTKNVLIEDIDFDNGDDNVVIKAGRDREGREMKMPSHNIVVRNCRLKGLHGLVIGSEMSSGVHSIYVDSCDASGYLKRGLYVKSNPDRGGEISNIHFNNVELQDVEDAFFITSFYHQEGEGHVTHIHDIYVNNVYCREASAAGIVVHGFPELKVHDIYFSNVTIEKADVAIDLRDARNVIMEDVSIGGQAGPPSWAK